MKLSNVDGHIADANVADANLAYKPITDLNTPVTADSLGKSALCDRAYFQSLRRFIRDDGNAGAGIQHKFQLFIASVDLYVDQRSVADQFEWDVCLVESIRFVERRFLPEIREKIYKALDSGTAVRIHVARKRKEPAICVGR